MNEAAIRRLQELADENGGTLTPRVVVDDARTHRGGPLHAMFDWDDASAADNCEKLSGTRNKLLMNPDFTAAH